MKWNKHRSLLHHSEKQYFGRVAIALVTQS